MERAHHATPCHDSQRKVSRDYEGAGGGAAGAGARASCSAQPVPYCSRLPKAKWRATLQESKQASVCNANQLEAVAATIRSLNAARYLLCSVGSAANPAAVRG